MSDFEPVRVSTGSSSDTETTREQRERVERARNESLGDDEDDGRVDISEDREVTRTGPRPVERDVDDESSDSDTGSVVSSIPFSGAMISPEDTVDTVSSTVSDVTPSGDAEPVRERLQQSAETFDARVTEPAADLSSDLTPVTEVDRALPGTPTTDAVEGFTRGAVSVVNLPAQADFAIATGERVTTDTSRTVSGDGDEVRADAAEDVAVAAGAAGSAVRSDPVGSISQGAGMLVGGTAAGTAVFRGAQRASRTTVRGPDLDDFVTDARATTTGRQRSRSDTDDMLEIDGSRSGRDFEADMRQQELSQDQRMLRDQATAEQQVQREVLDGLDDTGPAFEPTRGPTIDPDAPTPAGPVRPTGGPSGQQVPRGFGDIDRASNVPRRDLRQSVETTAPTASPTAGVETAAPVGVIAAVNDPTGISDTDTPVGSSDLDQTVDSVNDPTGITDTDTPVGSSDLDQVVDPSGVGDATGTQTVDSVNDVTAISDVDTTRPESVTRTQPTDSVTDTTGPVGDTGPVGLDGIGDQVPGLDQQPATRSRATSVQAPALDTPSQVDPTGGQPSGGRGGSGRDRRSRRRRRIPIPTPEADEEDVEFEEFSETEIGVMDVEFETRTLPEVDRALMEDLDGP